MTIIWLPKTTQKKLESVAYIMTNKYGLYTKLYQLLTFSLVRFSIFYRSFITLISNECNHLFMINFSLTIELVWKVNEKMHLKSHEKSIRMQTSSVVTKSLGNLVLYFPWFSFTYYTSYVTLQSYKLLEAIFDSK